MYMTMLYCHYDNNTISLITKEYVIYRYLVTTNIIVCTKINKVYGLFIYQWLIL